MRNRRPQDTELVRDLVTACLNGDQEAWCDLVRLFSPLVWTVARSHRLSTEDCQDVYQMTWTRVVQHLRGLRSPERFADWLTTAARRESLKHLQRAPRHVLVGDGALLERSAARFGGATDQPEEQVLRGVVDTRVLEAFRQLPERDQQLLGVLLAEPPPTYDEVSRLLGIPRGSIGPWRGRALVRLRELLENRYAA